MFCDSKFMCKWKGCSFEIEIKSQCLFDADERFQAGVWAHLDEHVVGRDCGWEGCRSKVVFESKRAVDRHVKTHLPWFVFCRMCDVWMSRRDQMNRHLEGHLEGGMDIKVHCTQGHATQPSVKIN